MLLDSYVEDFSFHSSPLLSSVSTNLFIVSVVKPDNTWSSGRNGQNQNEMSSHSLLVMSAPHHTWYFRLACGKVAINIGKQKLLNNWTAFSAVLSSAEQDLCGYSPHNFILPACVAMVSSKMVGSITVSNSGEDVSLLFGWLPYRL